MNHLDISFEPAGWETVLGALRPGSSYSAARFLTLMEAENEEETALALAYLDKRDILLDIASLPEGTDTGDTALRLRREAELVKNGTLMTALEDTDPLRLYLEELAATPVCGDVQLLAEAAAAGDDSVRERLAGLMLSAVVETACAYAGKGVLLLDLIQEGSLGLWQAILEFEGGDFESFCNRRIRQVMAKTVTLQARENGVGQRMRQAVEDYRTADQQLLTRLGRNPSPEEIAAHLNMTPDAAAVVADMLDAAQMLNRAKTASQPREETPEDAQSVENTAYFQMRQRIAELLSILDAGDARILTLRFGLEGGLPMSAADTARKLGMTPEEVTRRETAALAKMRNEG